MAASALRMLWLPGMPSSMSPSDFAVFHHGEGGGTFEIADVGGGVVGVLPAVGNGVVAAGAEFVGDRILGAIDQFAAGLVGERGEDLADVVEVPIEIEVLGLDVEDHRVLGVIERERAVAFIAFRDHELAVFGPLGVGAEDRDFRADVVARFLAGLAQDVGGHRGGGGFPVGAGNDDALARVEDGGEAFGAAEQRDLRGCGGGVGRVVRADGRGINDEVRASSRRPRCAARKTPGRRPACARFPRW